jgi:hypothetical protein
MMSFTIYALKIHYQNLVIFFIKKNKIWTSELNWVILKSKYLFLYTEKEPSPSAKPISQNLNLSLNFF